MKSAMKALIAEASAWSTCHFAAEFLKFSESFRIFHSRELGCKICLGDVIAVCQTPKCLIEQVGIPSM